MTILLITVLCIYITLLPLTECGQNVPYAGSSKYQNWIKLVKEAYLKAKKATEKRSCVNTFWNKYGVDGKDTRADTYNKRRDKGHQPSLIEFGEFVLEMTHQLNKLLTDKTLDEVLALPAVQAKVKWLLCPQGSKKEDCHDKSKKYRTINGICNNKKNPNWGSALSTERRFLPAVYSDSVKAPRKSVLGGDLPSARLISNQIFRADMVNTPLQGFTTLLSVFWGQFLDHDFVLTPVSSGDEHKTITCCLDDKPVDRAECLSIEIPEDDPHYNRRCMPLVRSAAAPQVDPCSLGPKAVLNELTSYIDASNVYGSSMEQALILRSKTMGLLNVLVFDEDTEMLAENPSPDVVCMLSGNDTYCQIAGDSRVNEQPALSGIHLLFVREHQRVVRELKKKRPDWKDNKLYFETRKIIGALMQQITYGEYLPLVLTPEIRNKYKLNLKDKGYSKDYDSKLDATIKTEFAAAAFRFGHSQIPNSLGYLMADFNTIKQDTPLEDLFLDPELLVTNGGQNVVKLARFIVTEGAHEVDRFFESSIRNTLFGNMDLSSLNIQRGRDNGLAPYTEFRRYCKLSVPRSFEEMTDHSETTRNAFNDTYRHVDDIDLFAGGISELSMSDSTLLGPTFSCLLGEQFRALKRGDRFWYERKGKEGFKSKQLKEIRKVKLSKIMCDNFGFDMIQPDVFHKPIGDNARVPCKDLPEMSFEPWK